MNTFSKRSTIGQALGEGGGKRPRPPKKRESEEKLQSVYHLFLSLFEKIRLPKDIPKLIPIPIPALLLNPLAKTTLQSIAAIIPMVVPTIILLLFTSLIPQYQLLAR